MFQLQVLTFHMAPQLWHCLHHLLEVKRFRYSVFRQENFLKEQLFLLTFTPQEKRLLLLITAQLWYLEYVRQGLLKQLARSRDQVMQLSL